MPKRMGVRSQAWGGKRAQDAPGQAERRPPCPQVVRDTQVDCALAELYMASRQTQAAVAGVAQAEAMQSVMLRLNELEDSLTWVQVVS